MIQSIPPSDPQPTLLVAPEVASLLRIALATVYQWCATGKIPHLKLNGVIRFQRHQIEQWLSEQADPGTHPAPTSRPSPTRSPSLSRQTLRMAGQRVVRRFNRPSPQVPGHPHNGTSRRQTRERV